MVITEQEMLLSQDTRRQDDKFWVVDDVGICDLGKAGFSCDTD